MTYLPPHVRTQRRFCFHIRRLPPLCQYLNITVIFRKIITRRFLLQKGINRDCRRLRTCLDRVMTLYNQHGVPLRRLWIVLLALVLLCIGAFTSTTEKEVTQQAGALNTSYAVVDACFEVSQKLTVSTIIESPECEPLYDPGYTYHPVSTSTIIASSRDETPCNANCLP